LDEIQKKVLRVFLLAEVGSPLFFGGALSLEC